mgnify:CR=1 FL=1
MAAVPFIVHEAGWDSVAVDAGGEYIFKFPRDHGAASSLEKEARLLGVIRPQVSMLVPDLVILPGPPVFSRHRKIPGEHLLTEHYAGLPEAVRDVLAEEIATFYRELHRIDPAEISSAGAGPVPGWPAAGELLQDLEPLLDPALHRVAGEALAAWEELPPDPVGTVYGFFDGHGWNMAFDHAAMKLNGIFDFADSGFGDLHREFIYTDFISRDLTLRVIAAYEKLSGVSLDRSRIDLLSGVLRLSDYAGTPDHPMYGEMVRRNAVEWLTSRLEAGSLPVRQVPEVPCQISQNPPFPG